MCLENSFLQIDCFALAVATSFEQKLGLPVLR
jgi:hypothetical protein